MLWLKLIPLNTGLLFLSINIIILASHAIKILLVSFSKTKIAHLDKMIIAGILILFIITALPSFLSFNPAPSPSQKDIEALQWLKNNTSPEANVFGAVREGYLINYVAERKNIIDSNFLFIRNINQKYADMNSLFILRLESEAVRLINQYKINYLFVSSESLSEYNMTGLFYAGNSCFEKMYDKSAEGGAIIYKFMRCTI